MAQMYRLRAVTTGVGGAPYYSTMYFAVSGGTAQGAMDDFRTLLTAIKAIQSQAARTVPDPAVTIIDTVTGQPVGTTVVNAGADIVGTSGAVALPYQVQLGVNVKTGSYSAGRLIQGHFSVGAITQNAGDGPQGPGTNRADVILLQTALNNLAVSSASDWVVYSRKNGILGSVVTAKINPRWFTLRSRLV